jgi:hypothetical protein
MPTVWWRPAEMERREAQIHDPFPDAKFGPDLEFRPLQYRHQRSEPQRAKDRFYASMLRLQHHPAPPAGPVPGFPGTNSGPVPNYHARPYWYPGAYFYPEVVR